MREPAVCKSKVSEHYASDQPLCVFVLLPLQTAQSHLVKYLKFKHLSNFSGITAGYMSDLTIDPADKFSHDKALTFVPGYDCYYFIRMLLQS